MSSIRYLRPCLWFNDQAEEAAKFYTSIFKNSKITQVTHYPAAGKEIHGHEAGAVMTVTFELDGRPFLALNGGPLFKFSEAISLEVGCDTQEEIDYFWSKLTAGGSEQPCGWLKDKFGLSWQIAPANWAEMMGDSTSPKMQRAFAAMMTMKKLDIRALELAAEGK